MARNFRFYEKKRGDRRTGSQKLGSAGESLFFAVFFLLGCAGLIVLFFSLVVPEWKANHHFVKATCTVLGARVVEKESNDGLLYRPEIQIEYQVEGESYRIWTYNIHTLRDNGHSTDREDVEAIIERFSIGREYYFWYNPTDPKEAVLIRGVRWWIWLIFIVPISFLLIGGGGVLYTLLTWGKSAERRSAMAQMAANLDLSDGNGHGKSDFPYVPAGTNTTDSPGTTLAFRLPIDTAPGWALLALLLGCLLWNGIVLVFIVLAVGSHLEGDPDWFLTFFIVPFALVGIGMVVYFFRQLLVTTGIGPTLMEISDQPLYPGKQYRLFLSQPGRLKMNSLEVLLVCDEEATYRHGTDTRTESRRVYQQMVFRREAFEIPRGLPFQTGCQIELPQGAMHSFKSDHNEITWKVVVKGNVSGWPDYERSFPVIVHPCGNGNNNLNGGL